MQVKQFLSLACLLTPLMAAALPDEQLNVHFRRGQEIPHDQVRVIPESLPNDNIGRNMKRFQPYFNNEGGGGCWPYPAVDSDGNWSGGLKPSGKESGDCRNSVGQVYVRGAWYKGRYGIMYTWFAPKDETGVGGGHRYEWEGAVIWVNNPNVPDAKMVGGAVSAHHGWKTTTNIAGDVSFYQGHPLCKYYVDTAVFGTHRIGWTDKVGGLQPAVAWEQLPAPARNALLSTDWGHATFMLGYGFLDHLANAYPF
ncbi:hypothetical protein E4U35_007246 [Claviceps purpurea]|nr:hypothetical protein E4U38_008442 [Claviceps purpurea]KAG6195220.1 hypothetical protein E4U10_002085 [Claviceps purpurea]KAG6212389.1 hypothetical protein E4U35_007246 [Claviceps purpurea]KAG6212405.1 hypothetical protein E4U50_001915 [Claviceps purpurea]KAG6225399.1 hypothetical protein E4U26_003064 [Claviceps purpurea]